MPLEPKAQLVDPQGPLDVDGINATGITTATGGFVGQVQGAATGLAATTYNIQAGIITATRFIGDVTGTSSSLAQGANITVGVMTASSFVGDLLGNATGLSTTTSNLNLGIVTSTGFRGNFTGLSSGLSGTPNIQTGIVTATKFLGNSSGTVVDLADDTNINVGIFTATKFEGNTTGSVTKLADDTNINVGIITASKFIGNANGSVTGLADDTNINVATFTATEFKGNSPGTAADLKSGTNLTVGTFTGTKFIGNTPGSATKLADDVNVNAGTFTASRFVGNTPGSVSDIADDTNLNMGTLTATQFIGNSPGNATGISAAQNIAGGTITATTFYGNGAALTGAGSTAYIRQTVTASSSGTINLNLGNVVNLVHDANVTISFSNVPTATDVTIIRNLTANTITWPSGIVWDGGSAPTLLGANSYGFTGQVFNLITADGGTTWYGSEEVSSDNSQPGTAWGWGYNYRGEVKANDNAQVSSPVQIPGDWDRLHISKFALGSRGDGALWVWGQNSYGELAQNTPNNAHRSSPIQIGTETNWSRNFTSANRTALAVKTDGTMWGWGINQYGGLGQNEGDNSDYSSPVQIPGTWSTNSQTMSVNDQASVAIKADGTLWVMGYGSFGGLGLNSTAHVSSPTQLPGNTWKTVGGGWAYGAATKTDGTLWCWGTNNYGQCGQNSTNNGYSSPVQVPGTTWDKVCDGETGSYSAGAVKTDGTLWMWGVSNRGQTAQNDVVPRSSPVQVPGTNWDSVYIGTYDALARKTDGTAWYWGYNNEGQSGQNTRNPAMYSSPVQIPGDWLLAGTSAGSNSFGIKSPS